jgi:arginine exporter protein ArgO
MHLMDQSPKQQLHQMPPLLLLLRFDLVKVYLLWQGETQQLQLSSIAAAAAAAAVVAAAAVHSVHLVAPASFLYLRVVVRQGLAVLLLLPADWLEQQQQAPTVAETAAGPAATQLEGPDVSVRAVLRNTPST